MGKLFKVDELILDSASDRWRKVAFVVGAVLAEVGNEAPELNDEEVANRVRNLVSDGLLESRGDLDRIRYSEIRRSKA